MPEEPYTLTDSPRRSQHRVRSLRSSSTGRPRAKYVGGTGLATKYLWDEVPAGVKWSDPENRITFFTGPLAGTRVCGSGTFSVTTLGACTNMCGTSQANGFFGAFMRQNGIDGIIVQGAAEKWTRLHIRGRRTAAPRCRAPAGPRHLGDRGRGHRRSWASDAASSASARRARTSCASRPSWATAATWRLTTAWAPSWAPRSSSAISADQGGRQAAGARSGASGGEREEAGRLHQRGRPRPRATSAPTPASAPLRPMGAVPMRNYTTNVFPEDNKYVPEYMRSHFKAKPVVLLGLHRRPLPHHGRSPKGTYAGFRRRGAGVRGRRPRWAR